MDESLKYLTEAINNDESLAQEDKEALLASIGKLSAGTNITIEESGPLMHYLDETVTAAENDALAAGDMDLVKRLTEIRNQGEDVIEKMLGIQN